MSELATYPIIPSPKSKLYSMKRSGCINTMMIADFLHAVSPEYRFMAQQMIANMRFDMLKHLIAEGLVPCKPLEIELEVRVVQESLPDEILNATDGRRIELQEGQYHIENARIPFYSC